MLWLGFAFLCRHVILMMVAIYIARRAPDDARLLIGQLSWVVLPLQAPALLLAWAGLNRAPGAWAFARWAWHRARTLIVLAALGNLAWVGYVLMHSDRWSTWPELFLVSGMLVDLAITYAVLTDPFFARLFSDFPSAPSEAS